MSALFRKPLFAIVLSLVVLAVGVFAFFVVHKQAPEILPTKTIEAPKNLGRKHEVIGKSVEGRTVDAYTYGTGKTRLVFVGGMHGGYEWNSVLLAYAFMDYVDKNPAVVSDNLSVTVIPSLNPDAVYKVVGKEGRFVAATVSTDTKLLASARFNAHGVDLNRNFNCNWKPTSMWQSKIVSGGSAAFSEPEAKALQSFVSENNPDAFVFWHSQANGVYASKCQKSILPETLDVMNAYSRASGYPAVKTFDAYETTGAADDWLSSINIPAITVELRTHKSIEWERNLAGIKALLLYYGQKKEKGPKAFYSK